MHKRRDGVGQGLCPIMISEGRKIAPRRITTEYFHDAGEEHQLKQHDIEHHTHDPMGLNGMMNSILKAPRHREKREETHFTQKSVPLKAHKLLAGGHKRKIK